MMYQRNRSLSQAVLKAAANCLEAGIPFAVYCMPESKSPIFGCPDPTRPFPLVWDGTQTDEGKGFILSQFNQDIPEVPFIPMEWDAATLNRFIVKHPDFKLNLLCATRNLNPSDDADELLYKGQVKRIIKALKGAEKELGGLPAKMVLSRSKTNTTSSALMEQVGNQLYKHSSSKTFFYMAWHPETGFWTAATPEVAADYNAAEEQLSTMALAGTQPSQEALDMSNWSLKNRNEQAIVASVIIAQLQRLGAKFLGNPERVEVEILDMGMYSHLVSYLNFKVKPANLLESMLAFTPTPALLGFPGPLAIELIDDIELHDRECYGGLVGVVDTASGDASLYVNLRCMTAQRREDNQTTYRSYAGGGILVDSEPTQEWHEANMKFHHATEALIFAEYSQK